MTYCRHEASRSLSRRSQGSVGATLARASLEPLRRMMACSRKPAPGRKILIAGGGFGTAYIRYMAQLTGKPRPKLLDLADRSAALRQRRHHVVAKLRAATSSRHTRSALSPARSKRAPGRTCSSRSTASSARVGTRNQQAIWKRKASTILRQGGDRGIVPRRQRRFAALVRRGHHHSGRESHRRSIAWGFRRGSHSPHHDAELVRRPLYQKMIVSGQVKPGYACEN